MKQQPSWSEKATLQDSRYLARAAQEFAMPGQATAQRARALHLCTSRHLAAQGGVWAYAQAGNVDQVDFEEALPRPSEGTPPAYQPILPPACQSFIASIAQGNTSTHALNAPPRSKSKGRTPLAHGTLPLWCMRMRH